jgi:lysophospholipase
MASASLYRRAIPAGARVSRWHAPDGWALRRFDWPAVGKPRGAMLFQGGRGDIFEKYLESFAHWHTRGWSITSFDWRGQGGSGRLSANPLVGHAVSFDPFISDFRAFWAEWQGTTGAGPRVALGHSMGGHLLLRALAEDSVQPDATVMIAPMLGLHSPLGAVWGERLARLMARMGDPARAAWKANERPATLSSRQTLLTHDLGRYEDELWWRDAEPELRFGPPSWQWVGEAFASTRQLEVDSRLGTIDLPLLMLVAEADKLVDPRAALRIAATLPDCRLERFGPESAHEILREADSVRDRALATIDAFFDERAPAR